MENLAQIETINQKIRIASVSTVTALHKLIFEKEGDRKNRQRIRDFRGFAFVKDTARYADNLEYGRELTIGDLLSCCNLLGLEYNGTQEELIARILDGLVDLNTLAPTYDGNEAEEENDEDEGETDEEANDDTNSQEGRRSNRGGGQTHMKFSMTYRDVKDSVKTFSGKDSYPVEKWISDFEDTADLYDWTDLQKMVFAKK